MAELLIGVAVGVLFGAHYDLDGQAALGVAAGSALLLYAASCAVWPRRKCWRCRGAKFRTDGRGNLRDRRCLVCSGAGTVRRVGSVLLGSGGR